MYIFNTCFLGVFFKHFFLMCPFEVMKSVPRNSTRGYLHPALFSWVISPLNWTIVWCCVEHTSIFKGKRVLNCAYYWIYYARSELLTRTKQHTCNLRYCRDGHPRMNVWILGYIKRWSSWLCRDSLLVRDSLRAICNMSVHLACKLVASLVLPKIVLLVLPSFIVLSKAEGGVT